MNLEKKMHLRFIVSFLCLIALLNSFCTSPVESKKNDNWENSALAFDGKNTFVDVSSIGRIGSDAVSVAAWVRPENINGDRAILYRGTSDNRFGIFLGIRNSMIWAGGNNSGTDWSEMRVDALEENRWTHVAAVFNGKEKTIAIYKNGTLIHTATNRLFKADTVGCKTIIGRNHVEKSQHFQGAIDNVAIWNKAITEQDVALAMKGGLAKDTPGLFAYFAFHENTGDVTTDYTSKEFKGTLGDGTEGTAPEWVRVSR